MSFLKKMFGKQNSLDEMRRCHARQDWAGVLNFAGQIDRNELDAATCLLYTSDAADDSVYV